MTNDLIYLHNINTDEIVVTEMTTKEQMERDAQVVAWKAEKKVKQQNAESLWKIKIAAYQKLGLTDNEIEAIAPKPEWLKPKENAELGGTL